MKKFLLAGSALLSGIVLASAAQAADMPAAGYDWTGFYAGVNAGGAMNNSSLDSDTEYDGTRFSQVEQQVDGDQTAFTGGAMLGYNWQMDKIVLGVETDFNYLGFSQNKETNYDFGSILSADDVTATTKGSFEANWYGTLRGRLGFAADNMLFYGTGGLAYGHMKADSSIEGTVVDGADTYYDKVDGSNSSTNFGWTLGAGMEYGIDKWTVGLEYLYVDLGSAEWEGDRPARDGYEQLDLKGSVDYQFSVVRATAKLRF